MFRPTQLLAVAATALVTTALMTAGGQPTPGGDSRPGQEKAIRDLEATEAKAAMTGDLATLERLWDESFAVNAPVNRVVHRKTAVGMVRDGTIKYTRFDRRVEYVGLHGDATAVAMGQESVTPANGPDAGKTLERRYTNVWQKKAGTWTIVARQATIIPSN